MSAQRLTDAQIATALRAHLPAHARADVRMRIAAEVSTSGQLRPMPSVFAPFADADPEARRRAMLLLAAALLAVGVVAAAGVGTLLRRNEPVRITIDPAVNAPGFVEEAFAAHRVLPPMTLVARMWDQEGGPDNADVQRFYVNALGHLRHECCGGTIIIVGGPQGGSTNQDGSGNPIWLIGSGGDTEAVPGFELASYGGFQTSDCRLRWRYVGPEQMIDRPAHHLACPQDPVGDVALPDLELWLDAELGVALRTTTWGIQMDENNEPAFSIGSEMAVESIVFGEPDPALFQPPPDLRAMTLAEYNCEFDPPSCEAATAPPATLGPPTTPVPADEAPEPPDIPALVATTLQSYAGLPAMEIVIEERGGSEVERHRFTDGAGAMREERYYDPTPAPPIITLWIPEGFYETWYLDDGSTEWRRLGNFTPGAALEGQFTLGLPELCNEGWEYLGLDVVLESEAWHVACGRTEFWIDRARLLVVRRVLMPDALHFAVETQTVLRVELGPQPPDLFELPEGATVIE
jgi:hypothetical protein